MFRKSYVGKAAESTNAKHFDQFFKGVFPQLSVFVAPSFAECAHLRHLVEGAYVSLPFLVKLVRVI